MAVADPVARAGRAICMNGCAGSTCGDRHARTFDPAATLAVTAPAVAIPYPNPIYGTVAITSMAVEETMGEAVVAGVATTISAGPVVAVKDAHASSKVQGACRHSVPCSYTKEELRDADPLLQWFTDADHWLLGIFGNAIHQNNGTHLNGRIGISEDAKWQRLHKSVAACSLQPYNLPTSHLNGSQTSGLESFSTAGTPSNRWSSMQSSYTASSKSMGSMMLGQSFGVNWMSGMQVGMWLW
jgi:hypothetical protein